MPTCQNDSLWNAPLNDVIVWISTTSAEEYRHHRVFSPAHRFVKKNLDNIISRPQRTVRIKETEADHDLFKQKGKTTENSQKI